MSQTTSFKRLRAQDIPAARLAILKTQGGRCALCRIPISAGTDSCLDHDHRSGRLRSVLCRNCNQCEGKVFNLARRAKRDGTPLWWLQRLIEYWKHHEDNPIPYFHPLHKTDDEKRLLRNKRARKVRASNK